MSTIADLQQYSQLPDPIKVIARKSCLSTEKAHFGLACQSLKQKSSSNIHQVVNDPFHITKLVSRLAWLKRLITDVPYFEKCIEENLCMFSPSGDLYLFTQKCFASDLFHQPVEGAVQ